MTLAAEVAVSDGASLDIGAGRSWLLIKMYLLILPLFYSDIYRHHIYPFSIMVPGYHVRIGACRCSMGGSGKESGVQSSVPHKPVTPRSSEMTGNKAGTRSTGLSKGYQEDV